ncbi:hypothetical protein Scep_025191 [Stephania cephalantha]|uniref:EamA domain-containing protein n=1 Tax=Stephania cephalantha TaxID=152367 RepID=A0AAP0EN18_9MAGN
MTVSYAGIVGSGLCFVGMSWCVRKRGPLFTAAFSPLIQIIVAFVEFIFLHEQLYFGSVLGSVLVIIGLYILLWGKDKEAKDSVEKPIQAADEGGQMMLNIMCAMKETIVRWRPALCMITVQMLMTGMQLLSRIILTKGTTSVFALMTYRHIVAVIVIAPLAFFLERDEIMKNIKWHSVIWLFCNALTGISIAMGLFYYGIHYTTATYASNFLSLIPVVTFLLSIITRMEKLDLRSQGCQIKIGGSIVCLAGALTYSLCHWKPFHITPRGHHNHQFPLQISMKHKKHGWICGTLMLIGSCFSYAMWFLMQVKLAKVFPLRYWTVVFTCLMATLQALVMGLSLGPNKVAWRLGWNLQLVTIIYSGALSTGATFCLTLWTVQKKGPIYPSMFNPLSVIFVSALEAVLFGEALSVGSVVGMFMIIFGLYAFLLGKKNDSSSADTDEVSRRVPESKHCNLHIDNKEKCEHKEVRDKP